MSNLSEERHNDGRCVVALPADDEPIHAFGEEDKHCTLLWLGTPSENPELDMGAVQDAVASYAADTPPFISTIDKTGDLGDEGAYVSFLNPDDVPHHDALRSSSPVLDDAYNAVEQYPSFTPHVTLGYPPEGEEPPPAPTGTILFDRLAIWDGENREEFPLQRITAMPVTDVFTLQRSIALANKLPAGHIRDAARRALSRRARDLGCVHAIPTQWLRDRQASAKGRVALVEKYQDTTMGATELSNVLTSAAAFSAKALHSGLPDGLLRTAYMRAVRHFAMLPQSARPPLSREMYAQARVNSLIRLASGDPTARTDDRDLLDRAKESR